MLAATVWGACVVCLQTPVPEPPARSRRVLPPEEPHSPIRPPPERAEIADRLGLSVEEVSELVRQLATSDMGKGFDLDRRLQEGKTRFDPQEERSKTAERWATDICSVLMCHTPLVCGCPQCWSACAGGSR